MTKKHFIKIAAVIRNYAGLTPERGDFKLLAEDLCVIFKDANKDFDKARFMAACGF